MKAENVQFSHKYNNTYLHGRNFFISKQCFLYIFLHFSTVSNIHSNHPTLDELPNSYLRLR